MARLLARAILGCAVALTCLPVQPAAAGPEPGLVLHYDFDGDPSTGVVTDSSPSGLDGVLINPGAATTVTGPDGSRALSLPGGAAGSTTAPYVRIPGGLFRGRSAMTISTWLNWDGGADFQWVYNLGKDAATATFVTPSYAGPATSRSSIKPVDGSGEVGVDAVQRLPTGRWLNLVTTIDGQRIVYYLNGVAVGSATARLDLAAVMHDDSTSGLLGRPFWNGHPFLAGDLDDLRVYDSVLDAGQVAALAGDRRATLTAVDGGPLQTLTYTGTAPTLPAGVAARFSDGIRRNVPVAWDPVEPARYHLAGTFTATGTAAGVRVEATVTVIDNTLTVDLATSTGPFHGGASGTLYGVYGDGVPTRNLIEGINLRTVSTKAQDGPQHPGADALEVVKPLADSTDGDVYIYMTDIYRGFPYQWPGGTPQARLDDFKAKIIKQVDQVRRLDAKYQDNIVFVPFNEPEGNMFGDGEWSYNRVSWLTDPQYYFRAWDEVHALIKARIPDARIAGPNTSILYDQIQGFLRHTVQAGTLPEVMTWHELSDPARIRASVATYRRWERTVFAGTTHEGRQLPVNINEYAFNYHTSVPGQMIQWISAIEDSKVDADIAYWNIDGNLSDSAVQANRGNGQWWLLNAYGRMTGHTVKVTAPRPDVSYTLQGVATLDRSRRQTRVILGGTTGRAGLKIENIDPRLYGHRVRAVVQEIPWTGQLGDSAQPRLLADTTVRVVDGTVDIGFGGAALPALTESSAYQVILTPAGENDEAAPATTLWKATYEAEAAAHTGAGYRVDGPQGSPGNVGAFYTSGGHNVGGFITGNDVTIDIAVDVPRTGTYDLSVFANSQNTYPGVRDQGPTNVFLRVDGAAEQELHLPLGYKWVVWDHTDTTVALTEGRHTITLATRSSDGIRSTKGDALIDRIDLSLPDPAAANTIYEAEHATLDGAGVSSVRQGTVGLGRDRSATFWVYAPTDGEATVTIDAVGRGRAHLQVNGHDAGTVTGSGRRTTVLTGGINKVTVTGRSGDLHLDRLRVRKTTGTLTPTWYEAEAAGIAGTATADAYSLAGGGQAVTGIGGARGNGNTLTFTVAAPAAGDHLLTFRYSNPEQAPATHYNPDPLARHADVSVNGATPRRVWFPHTFHENNFWDLSVMVALRKGSNTISLSAQEPPNFDGVSFASTDWPGLLLRSNQAPIIDRIAVTPTRRAVTPTR